MAEKSYYILESWDTCRHLEAGTKILTDECLVVQNGDNRDEVLVLCPLCAKLVREDVLSRFISDAVRYDIKRVLSSYKIRLG